MEDTTSVHFMLLFDISYYFICSAVLSYGEFITMNFCHHSSQFSYFAQINVHLMTFHLQ